MKTLTKTKAIQIQNEQLTQWKTVLKKDAFNALYDWAKETNDTVTNPYSIRRGSDLSVFVSNFAIQKSIKK